MIGKCTDMIVLKGDASKATSPEVVYIDIQVRNAMVSVYLTNNKWNQSHMASKRLVCNRQGVIDTQSSQKWQRGHQGSARPRHRTGTMQLTLAPVPAFFRSSSTANDLDPDPDANHKLIRTESGANYCLFDIAAISGEYSMAPTKAGLPELSPEPNQGSGGEQATSNGSVTTYPLKIS